jgi:anion-transporting  ArsA/GET3 family ATPase
LAHVPHQAGEHRPSADFLRRCRLVVVAGKGGVGKTTIAAALGLIAAGRGRRTIVVECGDRRHLAELFGVSPLSGVEAGLSEGLWSTTLDPERALAEWLRTLAGPLPVTLLQSSAGFQHFVAAAPGAKELISMVKVRELISEQRWAGPAARNYDLAILDAPATGHALAMLSSPRTFSGIARVGPLAGRSEAVQELLTGPNSAYLAVAQGEEMAVAETLELAEGLRSELGRELEAVIVNGTMPRRFSEDEMALIEDLPEEDPLLGASRRAARSVHIRCRAQRAQIARLRRRRHPDGSPLHVLSVPFAFQPELDLSAVKRIAKLLERRL